MHYGMSAFAIDDNKPTIYTCDQSYQYKIGEVKKPSPVDIERIKVLYGCMEPVCYTYTTLHPLLYRRQY